MSNQHASVAHASVVIDGDKLRRTRKAAGLTITQLAARLGISIGYLSQIERGTRRTVPPARYNQICAALDIADRDHLDMQAAAA
ncbi:helix-turn-helix transcriptional regulator [Micromonospora sp. NPDC000207]|uniref:helix-turn-helix domain-containing protein n=1 Tax=Micromonospora sp. NPDC000207 TaxID=3154246 RepID=UPI0033342C0E